MVSQEEILALVQANPALVGTLVALVVSVLISLFLLSKPKKPFLDPNQFLPLPLTEKKFITHNTVRMRFTLPSPKQRLGLPIGQHITFLAKDEEGKDIYRAYTPISDDDQLGSVDFVIKLYPQGKMSCVLNKLEVGQTMLMKGPKASSMHAARVACVRASMWPSAASS